MVASQIYALEGQCFVLHATAVAGQDMIDTLCDTPDKVQLLSPVTGKAGGGCSMIFGPDGSPLVKPLSEDQEGILYADLDLAMISIAKSAYDPAGHYSRPEVVP